MAKGERKTCYVICPIGDRGTRTRLHADQVLRHLIKPAFRGKGFEILRSDHEPEPGFITSRVIQQMVEAELVIADLSDRNPNVFYELAIRHVARKPSIPIIRRGEEIPFDVAQMRTVEFNLADPDELAEARKELRAKIGAVKGRAVENPVRASLGLKKLLDSGEPQDVERGEILSELQSLRTEVQAVRQQGAAGTVRGTPTPSLASIRSLAASAELPRDYLSNFVGSPSGFYDPAPITDLFPNPQADPAAGKPEHRRKGRAKKAE